jgi:nicotinate-nucleotide adenylyltransferase
VVVPAARNPLKEGLPGAGDAARAEMCRAMAGGLARAVVWTDELDRARHVGGGVSFTIDTVRRLRTLGAAGAIRLLLGADQAAQFHRWKDYEQLLEQAEPAVVLRPPIDTSEKLRAALAVSGVWGSEAIDAWLRRVVVAPVAPLSSTGVREQVRRAWTSESWGSLEGLVEPGVLAIIRREGLYRT